MPEIVPPLTEEEKLAAIAEKFFGISADEGYVLEFFNNTFLERRIGMTDNFFADINDEWAKTSPEKGKGQKKDIPSLPEGVYRCILVSNELGLDAEALKSTSTGSKGVKIFFKVLTPTQYEGEIIDHVFWLTLKNLPYVKRDLYTILGYEIEDLNQLLGGIFAGKTAELKVVHDTYKGWTNLKVAWFLPWKEEGVQSNPVEGSVNF